MAVPLIGGIIGGQYAVQKKHDREARHDSRKMARAILGARTRNTAPVDRPKIPAPLGAPAPAAKPLGSTAL